MPRNIEVKARLADPGAAREVVAARATSHPGRERQVDTYYRVDATGGSRVKVRDSDRHGLQLLRYARPEDAGVRASDYQRLVLEGPQDPRLAGLGEPLLVVTKLRDLYWVENVRVHLDEVEGLGSFLELEAVVDEDHDEPRCRRQVDELLQALGLEEADLLRASYSDLLAAAP